MKKAILILLIFTLHFSGFTQSLTENILNKEAFSFKDKSVESDIKIFPNPCKEDKVTIEFNNQEISEIRLTNIIGKEVLLKQFQFFENKKQIELSDIPNGIYLMQIKTTEGEFVVKKLMIARN